MLLKYIFLGFFGLTAGALVAGAVFAFVVKIGVIERLAVKTKTVKHVKIYEDFVVLGGALGNALYLFEWHVPFHIVMLVLFGIFSGIYVGALAFSLSEVINVFPVMIDRIKLTVGLPWIVVCFGLGKMVGALFQFFR